MARESTDESQAFLSTMLPRHGDRRLALIVVLSSAAIFAALVPFAKVPLRPVAAFIPVYQTALVVNDLMTAVLLFGQYRILRSQALLALATGYLFTAFIAAAHALTFPGLFTPSGLLGAGPQTTAWLYMFWHGGFPCLVIAYALLKNERNARKLRVGVGVAVLGAIAMALAMTSGFTLVATAGHDALPAIMRENHYTPVMIGVVASVWALSLAALLVAWRSRPRSVLDLWLSVVMCAWIFDIALSAVLNAGRFDVGFYAGRTYGLLAASFVLIVLLVETGGLYARLATTSAAAQRKAADLERVSAQLEFQAQQRTAALDALHNKEREIRAIVDNILDCVITIDVRGVVRSANPAVERVLGFTAEDVVGRNVSMLMPEPDRSHHDQYIARYQDTGEARIIGIGREILGRHKDGHQIPLELAVSEYRVHGERLFIGTLRDIRERKQLIVELTQARADAEQGSRAKSAFLATMSHEIRTPMNGVIGMVDVLARSRLSEDQKGLVATIRESAATLLGIIDDILDFSKIEAGRLQIEQAPLSVADLVEGISSSLVPVAVRRGVVLDVFVSPDIPDRVLSDDVRLRQVLYNLVGNAIKFSGSRTDRQGRVAVRAEVCRAAPLRVAFSIVDNGIGMAPDTLQKLFTPFTQAEVSTTRRFGGTGLGLTICKRLVDLMDGEISVASEPGTGSAFTVTLPFAVPAEQPLPFLPDLSGLDCMLLASPDLAVDDLRAYLEHAGASVLIVSDAANAAQTALGSAKPAVILLDERSRDASVDAALASARNLRAIVIGRGAHRRVRTETPEALRLDGDALRRRTLLRTVAAAVGRASPQFVPAGYGDAPMVQETAPPTVAEARARGELILVAEDDEINQKVILHQLGLLGYAAEVADDGVEALRLWREGEYALLLTDLHMPEMDGYALTESIRREERGQRRLPILALTANALRGEAQQAGAVGMDDYLTKPIQLHVLNAALRKWLPKAAQTVPPASGAVRERESRAPQAVDLSVLHGLIGRDADSVRGLLSDYLDSARDLAEELRVAWAAQNVQQVGAITHKLKSSSRSIGALKLGDLCAELENACRSEDNGGVVQALGTFEAALAAVETEIAGILQETT